MEEKQVIAKSKKWYNNRLAISISCLSVAISCMAVQISTHASGIPALLLSVSIFVLFVAFALMLVEIQGKYPKVEIKGNRLVVKDLFRTKVFDIDKVSIRRAFFDRLVISDGQNKITLMKDDIDEEWLGNFAGNMEKTK
jgi:hypothetical protein